MKLGSDASFWFAIALSSLLHAAVWSADSRRLSSAAAVSIDDRWSADSVEVGTEVEAPATAHSEAAPAPLVAPASEPADVAPSPAPPPHRDPAPSEVPAPRAPKLRAERAKKIEGAAASSSTSSEAAPAGSAQTALGPTGSMGALGLSPGVRHLAPAFTRALPASSYADPRWSELPSGPLGRTELVITVDESGHISDVSFDPSHAAGSGRRATRKKYDPASEIGRLFARRALGQRWS